MPTLNSAMTREEAEEFLFREAELLDDRRYDDWLPLFHPDGIYWMPINDGTDPTLEPSILYDDAALREQRVHQLLREPHYAQIPASRTLRSITNVRIKPDLAPDGSTIVRSNLLLTEFRPGDHGGLQHGLGRHQTFAADCIYHLRRDSRQGCQIMLRKILLLNRDSPVVNITFIV
jgi:3-phenylpropionate/cinnamic acid dioxygenase small subunit